MRGMSLTKLTPVRWAFCFSEWQPSMDEWILAGQCIQPEEKERVDRFVYKKDAKAALTGRLLLRKVVHEKMGIPYDEITFKRTDKGKPYISQSNTDRSGEFFFNVSHQGEFSVLAAQRHHRIGVDIMKVDEPRGTRLPQFFATMNRQFTSQEWDYIKSIDGNMNQLARFYRLWCLKESYVKALGIGIGFELQRLDFHVGKANLSIEQSSTETRLYVDGSIDESWKFEETRLDDLHYICVATQKIHSGNNEDKSFKVEHIQPFVTLSFTELINNCVPQSEPDILFWENFKKKEVKPGD